MRDIATGDEKAFTQLFDLYHPRVLHTALLFTKSQAMAEDIVQDVFIYNH